MIEIRNENGKLYVTTPYNSKYVYGAKKLGGKWKPALKVWAFDSRDDDKVRALLLEVYGSDGTVSGDLVTARFRTDDKWYGYCKSLSIGGRTIARAYGRDSGAQLGEGVILLKGKIGSGGSVKNWETQMAMNSEFEVKDIPRDHLDVLPMVVELIRIIENGIDIQALQAEKERLLARLNEIEMILNETEDARDTPETEEGDGAT